MGGLVAVQVVGDLRVLGETTFAERFARRSLTTLELSALWAIAGAVIYVLERRRGRSEDHDYDAAFRSGGVVADGGAARGMEDAEQP